MILTYDMMTVKQDKVSNPPIYEFTLPIATAKKVAKKLINTVVKGSFEYRRWLVPICKAIKLGNSQVVIITDGYKTCEFQDLLEELGANSLSYIAYIESLAVEAINTSTQKTTEMTTQEKLQSILNKFNLTCQLMEEGYFYIKDSDNNLVADFDTNCGYLYFCDYSLISSKKMDEIEQAWLASTL